MTVHDPSSHPEYGSTHQVIIWITDYRTGHEHAVTMTAADSAIRSRMGIYEATCGARFLPAPLTVPCVRRCSRCNSLREQRRPRNRRTTSLLRNFIHVIRRSENTR